MKRDGFIFYKSFADACIAIKNSKERLKLYDAIVKYGLEGEELELEGVPNAMFLLIKPQIDANNRKYENGKKGGRPKSLDERIVEAREKMKK